MLYREVGAKILECKPLFSQNSQLGITLHPVSENEYIAVAVNYSDKEQECSFVISDGYTLEVMHGSDVKLPACEAGFYKIKK